MDVAPLLESTRQIHSEECCMTLAVQCVIESLKQLRIRVETSQQSNIEHQDCYKTPYVRDVWPIVIQDNVSELCGPGSTVLIHNTVRHILALLPRPNRI